MTLPAGSGGKDWAVTAATERLTLDRARRAGTTIAVTNLRPIALSATVAIATDDSARPWFSTTNPVRLIEPGATESFPVTVIVPADAAPAEYAFQAQAYASDSAPEENPTYSSRILFTVAAKPQRRRFQLWWLAIPAALLVIAVTTVALVLVFRPEHQPPAPPSRFVTVPDLTGLDGVAAAAALDGAGLVPTVKHRHDPANAGTVVQSIPPGTEVLRDSPVEVVVTVSLTAPQLTTPEPGAVASRLPYEVMQNIVWNLDRTAATVEFAWTQQESYVGSWMVVFLQYVCLPPTVQDGPLWWSDDPFFPQPPQPEPVGPDRAPLPPTYEVVTEPALTATRYFAMTGGPGGGGDAGMRSCGDEVWAVIPLDDFGQPGPDEPIAFLLARWVRTLTTPVQPQSDWAVTTATERIALDEQRRAQTTITVTNLREQPQDVTVAVVTDDSVKGWFTVAEPDRRLDAGASSPVLVDAAVPPQARSGEYPFQVRAHTAGTGPDENATLSNRIVLDIPAAPGPGRRRTRWWWIVVIAAALVLVAGATTVLVITLGPDDPAQAPPAPATVPDVSGMDEPTAFAAVEQAGLIPTVKHRNDPPNEGTVTVSVPAGTEVARGTAIELIVAVSLTIPKLLNPMIAIRLPTTPGPAADLQIAEVSFAGVNRAEVTVEFTWSQDEPYVRSWHIGIWRCGELVRTDGPHRYHRLVLWERVDTTSLTSTRLFTPPAAGQPTAVYDCDTEIWAVAAVDDFGTRGPGTTSFYRVGF